MLKLEDLRVDSKVPPKFDLPHTILALFYFRERGPLGRYRLKQSLGIGPSSAKTLMKHLRKKSVIKPMERRGHILTRKGEEFIENLNIAGIGVLSHTFGLGEHSAAVGIKNGGEKVKDGLKQRDTAIKWGLSGATTVIVAETRMYVPPMGTNVKERMEEEIREKINLEKGDAVVIGEGDKIPKTLVGTMAAALTL